MQRLIPCVALALVTSCHGTSAVSDCSFAGTDGATAGCLTPRQSLLYYAQQSDQYFDTLDSLASRNSIPDYSTLVARWEWPPWLKLTAYGSGMIVEIDQDLTDASPSTVPTRNCDGFAVQPFGRCHVSFRYAQGGCPIYEEFTFNDQGQMTFIEAWSDQPGLRPTTDPSDYWAEGSGAHRLSTKVPGLGNATGLINLESSWMKNAAATDPDIADFVNRAENFWPTWTDELKNAGPDLYVHGCGWAADGGM